MFLSGCEKNNDSYLPVDGDGNEYDTAVIGIQIWLKQNLKTTKYINGDPIINLTNDDDWGTTKTGAYCWYDNDLDNFKEPYGALYNWYAVETGLLCPTGYHVPSNEEWLILLNYLGGQYTAASKLKETGTKHWLLPNSDATNESGFNALGGGERDRNGVFMFIKAWGEFWTSTEGDSTWAYNRSMNYYDSPVGSDGWNKVFGFSVRCVKDY